VAPIEGARPAKSREAKSREKDFAWLVRVGPAIASQPSAISLALLNV
jgi:hypothetical protein